MVVVMDVVDDGAEGVVTGTSVVDDDKVNLCCLRGLVVCDFATGAGVVVVGWGLVRRLARSGLTGWGFGRSWILNSVSNSTSSDSSSSSTGLETAAGLTRMGAGAAVGVGAREIGTRDLMV